MPLFEYICRACDRRFEFLTREGQAPACPACGGSDLEKALSTFAVSVASAPARAAAPAASPCASCHHPGGPGACQFAN